MVNSSFLKSVDLERVEVEKESLLRELEKTPEMEMMRARAQGEVERYKRDNSRLSARIAQLEQEQHEIRKEAATKEHLEARIEELSREANKGASKNDKFESESTKAREMVSVANSISKLADPLYFFREKELSGSASYTIEFVSCEFFK